MPYNANIPQAGNKLRNSQLDLLNNFQAIDAGFSFNHVDLNLADAGKHKLLTMPRQTLPQPAVNNLGTDLLMYVAEDVSAGGTGLSELYLKRDTDLATTGTPFTAKVTMAGGASGWTYLPSGLLVVWGRTATVAIPGIGSVLNIPFTFNGKAFAGPDTFSVVISVRRVSNNNITFAYITGLNQFGGTVTFNTTGGSGEAMATYYAIGLGA